jgi:hypothetical protein
LFGKRSKKEEWKRSAEKGTEDTRGVSEPRASPSVVSVASARALCEYASTKGDGERERERERAGHVSLTCMNAGKC